MTKVPISVVVITKNEEKNIAECLKSVYGWADEVIIVDDESTDQTASIAQNYADKIFFRRMVNEGEHRNWAYAQTKNEWVLSLDADEVVTDELKEEIERVLPTAQLHGFAIPRRNYIGDYWIRYGGLYPAGQLKLFRKSKFRYEEVEVHPRVFFNGQTGHLTRDIIHKSYRDFTHFLAKLNNQTTLEARKWIKTGRKMSIGRALWRTMDRFPRTYFRKKGYKDGFIGFMVAFFASLYQIISYAKYWEMKNRKARAPGDKS
jgi:glycosyltransferase involved in cell wall biosynthesis